MMNSLQTSVERENLGQFLLENMQDITDKLNQIVTDSDRIILDNVLQETQILFEQVKDNSKTYQARADIFGLINQLWFQVWKHYKNEGSAINLIKIINEFTDRVIAYNQLFIGLAQINEGKTGKEKGFFRTYNVENSPSSLSVQQCSKVDKYQSNKNSKLYYTSFTSISC